MALSAGKIASNTNEAILYQFSFVGVTCLTDGVDAIVDGADEVVIPVDWDVTGIGCDMINTVNFMMILFTRMFEITGIYGGGKDNILIR